MTKDKRFNWRFCLCCGIFIWFVLNLLQGIFTEIQEDEAYYALYGEHLAWGYFDHPPMVGLMTFLSSIFFSGTLGVRFFTIIASCLSLWVMWEMANPISSLDCFVVPPRNDAKRQSDNCKLQTTNCKLQTSNSQLTTDSQPYTLNSTLLFFIISFSVVMFNIYGFVTTPDASLILFSALFLLVYQRYLHDPSWGNALLMGLFMALMVYSKYHAFLLLGLIVLSNLRLLKDGKFYVACLLALALLMPHILWQIHADFPSFRYHLSGRSEPFRWSYFWEYLPNQLLIFNPFTFGAVVYVIVNRNKNKIKPQCIDSSRTSPTRNDMHCYATFERGLYFILFGFFFFFWLMAFRGHVEPHWTIVCMIPAVVLVYREALTNEKLRKYIRHFVVPSFLVILVARITLMTPMASRFGFNDKEECYTAIETVAGDRPVVFRGSFQRPALYHYFTGKPSSTLRCYYDRMTQYDLWQFDKDWIGQPVLVCGIEGGLAEPFEVGKVQFEGHLTEHFQTANRLVTHFQLKGIDGNTLPEYHYGDTIFLDFSIHNPYNQPIDFHHPEFDMNLKLLFLDNNEVLYGYHGDLGTIAPHSTYEGRFFAIIDDNISIGRNRIALGIGDRIATFTTHGQEVEIIIR